MKTCQNCNTKLTDTFTFCSNECHMAFERQAYEKSKERVLEPIPENKPYKPRLPKPIVEVKTKKEKRPQATGKERGCANCNARLEDIEFKYCSDKCRRDVIAKVTKK